MTVYMFPGQGSQTVGMGSELFELFPDITRQADEILGYSIAKLCLEDFDGNLSNTQYTQPALYTVNALMYFQEMLHESAKPNYVLGHSLGEYNALLAADVFDFATGLKLVKKRGELMSQAVGGAMAAVVGLTQLQVEETLLKNNLSTIDIANYNSPMQFVISGPENDVANAASYFSQQKGCLYIPLKVSGAFHSRLMKSSQQLFSTFLQEFEFKEPQITTIANVSAKPYIVSEIKKNLTEQISSPVLWTNSINYLINLGENDFQEVGPGKVLTNLLKKIRMQSS